MNLAAAKILLLLLPLSKSWVSQQRRSSRSVTLGGEIDEKRQIGIVLEGGAVIDFSSVKASSRAEAALSKARDSLDITSSFHQQSTLGISDDVVDQVGHSLGEFTTVEQIQECATYLRSQTGLFHEKENLTYSSAQIKTFQNILHQAYMESGEVTGAFAKTFHLGTMLLGKDKRRAIWAVYVWCRRTDEIVDAPRQQDEDMLKDLGAWEVRLEQLWEKGAVVDVFDLCLLDCRINYPTLSITPFLDMIRGMLMDVPDLGQTRYRTFEDLHLYCYRVAGTVGLMSLPILGCAEGFIDEAVRYEIFIL